jgi:glycerol uptake facilitator-like aquaporin
VPSSASGVFSTTAFLGPLFGGISNWFFLTLFIFSFSNASGSHLNPTISVATFFARLISFPRMVIYVLCQTLGGAIAGFILRKAYGSRDFTCGGCAIDQSLVPVDEAFLLEFMFSLILLFLSFGVGLDPRQGKIYGAALSHFWLGWYLARWAGALDMCEVGLQVLVSDCEATGLDGDWLTLSWQQWILLDAWVSMLPRLFQLIIGYIG